MTERIENALMEIEEEREAAIKLVIHSAKKIKKDLGSNEPKLELIKAINSNLCKFISLNSVANTLSNLKEEPEYKKLEEEPFQ